MKKTIAVLLCALMILSLCACGDNGTPGDVSGNNGQSETANQIADKPSQDSGKSADNASGEAFKALEEQFCGLKEDNLKWDYNSSAKTIVISGEGPMTDYSETEPEWNVYCSEAEHVVISDKVTSVGAGAFLWFDALKDVELSDTVEFIGKAAFSNCSALWTVNFPQNLKYVGDFAFNNNILHSETGFALPEGLIYVGESAFRSAFKENAVSVPASLSFIGDGAFANMFVTAFIVDENNPNYASVDGVFYDKAVTTLINYPADKQDTLFEIPETVTTILEDAVEVTNTLEKIVIPEGVSKIEEGSIFCNYALTNIEVDANNKSYKSVDGVLYTADGKLLLCYPIASDITEYTVLEGCERIGESAVSQAKNLTKLHTNEGLKEIGYCAFYDCKKLEKAGLPKSLSVIDTYAFTFCDALTEIVFAGTSAEWNNIRIGENNELLSDGTVQIRCAE